MSHLINTNMDEESDYMDEESDYSSADNSSESDLSSSSDEETIVYSEVDGKKRTMSKLERHVRSKDNDMIENCKVMRKVLYGSNPESEEDEKFLSPKQFLIGLRKLLERNSDESSDSENEHDVSAQTFMYKSLPTTVYENKNLAIQNKNVIPNDSVFSNLDAIITTVKDGLKDMSKCNDTISLAISLDMNGNPSQLSSTDLSIIPRPPETVDLPNLFKRPKEILKLPDVEIRVPDRVVHPLKLTVDKQCQTEISWLNGTGNIKIDRGCQTDIILIGNKKPDDGLSVVYDFRQQRRILRQNWSEMRFNASVSRNNPTKQRFYRHLKDHVKRKSIDQFKKHAAIRKYKRSTLRH